jgi:group I intron endonuclease
MTKRSALSVPGIYTITHIQSGRTYVGQTTNFRVRWMNHRRELRENRHRNWCLQEAWNEFGAAAFEFAIHQEMTDIPINALADTLNKSEVTLLAILPLTFNIMEAGESGIVPGQATRRLLSQRKIVMWSDPVFRAKRSADTKLLYADQKWKAKRDAAVREGKQTPKARAAVSSHFTALWKNEEHRTNQSAKRTANWRDPAYVAQQAASRAATWADPEVRERRTAGIKAAWARRKAATS